MKRTIVFFALAFFVLLSKLSLYAEEKKRAEVSSPQQKTSHGENQQKKQEAPKDLKHLKQKCLEYGIQPESLPLPKTVLGELKDFDTAPDQEKLPVWLALGKKVVFLTDNPKVSENVKMAVREGKVIKGMSPDALEATIGDPLWHVQDSDGNDVMAYGVQDDWCRILTKPEDGPAVRFFYFNGGKLDHWKIIK